MASRSGWTRHLSTAGLVAALLLSAGITARRFIAPSDGEYVDTPGHAIQSPDALATGYILGAPITSKAPKHVVVVEWSDFQCPVCAKMTGILRAAEREHGAELTVLYRNLPLSIHRFAYPAALAAACANEQGRFAAMHDSLFAAQAQFGQVPWETFAQRAGVPDTSRFGTCLRTRRYSSTIDRDMDVADSLRINATPAFVVNGKLFIGGLPAVQLEHEIRAAAGS